MEPAKANVRIRLDQNSQEMVQWEVDLGYVPAIEDQQGKDVIVEWSFFGVDFGDKLWYSANGLQMMEKKLNHREQFTMHTNQTFSSNFYPITSALATRDQETDLQITVMNDRTQSGSAGLRGNNNIELMQHRRLLIDDSKGLSEPMDERDSKKRGI